MPDHFQLSLTDAAISLDRVSKAPKTTQVVVTSRLGGSGRVGVTLVTNPGDAPIEATIEPREFVMEDGETREVSVTLTPGNTDVDVEVDARLQAYDVEAPQERFTTSGPITVHVQQTASFPWWIVAVAAGALLLVIMLILGFVLGWFGGDPDPDPTPSATAQATFLMPDLVGADVGEAQGSLAAAGDVIQHALGVEEGATEGVCVVFQTPEAGTAVAEGEAVDLVVTACPDEDVSVEEPTDDATLCTSVPSFCDALDEDVPGTVAQQELLAGQLGRFVDRFQVEGVEVPAMVGKTLALADELARVGQIDYRTIPADVTEGCVLYQVPFDGSLVRDDYTLTLVMAKCPQVREKASDVAINPATLTNVGDACSVLDGLCEELDVTSDQLAPQFAEYLETFRGTFSAHLVPDLKGSYVYRARQLLAERGLTLQLLNAPAGDDACLIISSQDVGAGGLAERVVGGVVPARVETGSPAPAGSVDMREDFQVELLLPTGIGDLLVINPCLFFLSPTGP